MDTLANHNPTCDVRAYTGGQSACHHLFSLLDEDDGGTNELQGRRILVLSLQGDILQVVTHPTEPTARFRSICCFDHKLLASYMYIETVRVPRKYEILALQGL